MKELTRLPEPLLHRQREFVGFLRSRLGTEEAARDAYARAALRDKLKGVCGPVRGTAASTGGAKSSRCKSSAANTSAGAGGRNAPSP